MAQKLTEKQFRWSLFIVIGLAIGLMVWIAWFVDPTYNTFVLVIGMVFSGAIGYRLRAMLGDPR